jgi:hypothetical protein
VLHQQQERSADLHGIRLPQRVWRNQLWQVRSDGGRGSRRKQQAAALSCTAFNSHKECGATNGRCASCWGVAAGCTWFRLWQGSAVSTARSILLFFDSLPMRARLASVDPIVFCSGHVLCCVVQAVSAVGSDHSRVQALWTVPHRNTAQQATGAGGPSRYAVQPCTGQAFASFAQAHTQQLCRHGCCSVVSHVPAFECAIFSRALLNPHAAVHAQCQTSCPPPLAAAAAAAVTAALQC